MSKKISFLKRTFDVLLSTMAIVIFFPFFLIIPIVIWSTMGWPVMFYQIRPGLMTRPFKFYKFRTMTNECDNFGCLLSDHVRMTPLGKFLRKSSLDELPQLWNVLKGDMSLVGPRPLLMEYLPRYTPHQMKRHEVRPGITGWAQVNGRNELSWEQKFDLDVWYVDNWSLKLDFQILFLTLKVVFRRSGINQPGHATMTEFKGYDC